MTTTDDNALSELDRLAWNIPAPREHDADAPRPWPPWPFLPIFEPDPELVDRARAREHDR